MPSTKMKKQKRNKGRFERLPRGANGGVELLLIQSVDHLGKQGEVVEVKTGYANNYLLPQGLATIASDHHKRMVDKHRAKLQDCLLYTSPSPRDKRQSRMPSSA